MAKVPVVTGLYVVKELEGSECESTEISRRRCVRGAQSVKVSPMCRENHALTDSLEIGRNSFSRLIFIALK